MKKPKLITALLLLISNAIGFNIGPIIFIMCVKFDLIDMQAESFNPAALQYDIVTSPIMIWMPCALFSFAAFFLTGVWHKFFLGAPIIFPMMFAFASLQAYML